MYRVSMVLVCKEDVLVGEAPELERAARGSEAESIAGVSAEAARPRRAKDPSVSTPVTPGKEILTPARAY